MATSKYKNPDKYIDQLKKQLDEAWEAFRESDEIRKELLSNQEKMHEIVVSDLKESHAKELAKLKEKDGRVVTEVGVEYVEHLMLKDTVGWDNEELPRYGDNLFLRFEITRVVVTKPEDEDETATVTIEAEPCDYTITTQRPKPC